MVEERSVSCKGMVFVARKFAIWKSGIWFGILVFLLLIILDQLVAVEFANV